MCDLYYLDQYRETVAEAENAEVAEKVAEAKELKSESAAALKMLSERTAKLMLDLAFNKITHMLDEAAMERLIRYAGELLRRADYNLNERQDCEAALKEFLESQIEDD